QVLPLAEPSKQPPAEARAQLAAAQRRQEVQHRVNRLVPARRNRGPDLAAQRDEVDVAWGESRAAQHGRQRLFGNPRMVLDVDPAFFGAVQHDTAVLHQADARVVAVVNSKDDHIVTIYPRCSHRAPTAARRDAGDEATASYTSTIDAAIRSQFRW